jgi:Xaa-Pro aminopeptidase
MALDAHGFDLRQERAVLKGGLWDLRLGRSSEMSISQQEYKRRYAAIRDQMKKQKLDCLLVVGRSDDFNRGNFRYITGSGSGGVCVFPMEAPPVLFTRPNRETSPKLPRTVEAVDLLNLKGTSNPVEEAVKELCRFSQGNKVGIVGMPCISVPMYLALKEKFPERLVDSVGIFDRLSVIKSPEEIEKTRKAAAIADEVYALLRRLVRPGISEYEIYGAVKKRNYEMGCEYSFELIDGFKSTMNMSFFPTPDKLEENGTLFFEITPAYGGYYAQLPITLPVGKYPSHVREMVRTWDQSDKAAQSVLGPGVKASDVYRTLMDTVQATGFISPLEAGHDLGLNAHGPITIDESDNTVLQPGMILAIHACVMSEVNGDGCGMGYTYLITQKGAERLSKVDLAEDLLG